MGALCGYVAMQVAYELVGFCRRTGAGHVLAFNTAYRWFGNSHTTHRGAVSFIRAGRFPNEQIPESVIEIPADLIVEVIAPNDMACEVQAKVELYLRNGFGEVWLVYPNTRAVYVYRKGGPVDRLDDQQILRGEGPLERFEAPVARLFPPAAPRPQP
jgi:Uma2 family endonuclease